MSSRPWCVPEQWAPLVEIFGGSSVCVVGAAVQWVESHGYNAALGSLTSHGRGRRTLHSLLRFVPELLAKQVVVIEKDTENTHRKASVSNCIWMQTLPNTMQADILAFLSVEHLHFQSKDLHALASCLLASNNVDFWVKCGVANLLRALQQHNSEGYPCFPEENQLQADPAMIDYYALPDWLHEYKEQQSLMCSDLPPMHNACSDEEDTGMQWEHEPQEEKVTVESKHVQVNSTQADDVGLISNQKGDEATGLQCSQDNRVVTTQDASCAPESIEAPDDKDEETARGLLGETVFTRAKLLRDMLHSSSTTSHLPEELDVIFSASDLTPVFKVVKPWLVEDEITALLVGTLLGEHAGYARSVQILTYILLPKLQKLKQPVSRILGSAVLQASKAHPRATVDALLLPLLLCKEGASPFQCDVINRVIKEGLTPELLSSLFHKLFCTQDKDHKELDWIWTEAIVGLILNLLAQGIVLREDTLEGLVSSLENASHQFSGSLKFGNLLLNLLTKHGVKLKDHKAALQQVAKNSKTFLTKSILAKLANL